MFANTMRFSLNMLSGIQSFTRVLEVFDLQCFRIIHCGVVEWLSLVRK